MESSKLAPISPELALKKIDPLTEAGFKSLQELELTPLQKLWVYMEFARASIHYSQDRMDEVIGQPQIYPRWLLTCKNASTQIPEGRDVRNYCVPNKDQADQLIGIYKNAHGFNEENFQTLLENARWELHVLRRNKNVLDPEYLKASPDTFIASSEIIKGDMFRKDIHVKTERNRFEYIEGGLRNDKNPRDYKPALYLLNEYIPKEQQAEMLYAICPEMEGKYDKLVEVSGKVWMDESLLKTQPPHQQFRIYVYGMLESAELKVTEVRSQLGPSPGISISYFSNILSGRATSKAANEYLEVLYGILEEKNTNIDRAYARTLQQLAISAVEAQVAGPVKIKKVKVVGEAEKETAVEKPGK